MREKKKVRILDEKKVRYWRILTIEFGPDCKVKTDIKRHFSSMKERESRTHIRTFWNWLETFLKRESDDAFLRIPTHFDAYVENSGTLRERERERERDRHISTRTIEHSGEEETQHRGKKLVEKEGRQ